jgi:hypothetical protein
MKNKNPLLIALLFFVQHQLFAGNSSGLMDSGKFFVVVSVLSTILIGVFILLVYLERKISKLEHFLKNK